MDEPTCTVKSIKIRHGDWGKICRLEFVGYEGRGVDMRFSDLTSRRAFQKKTLEVLYQLIPPPSIEDLNRLLRDAEYIP